MKEFKGRVIVPGTCSAEALVSRGGFNTLASFQMAIMFNKKGVPCGDQNNPDIYNKKMQGKALCLPITIGSTTGGMVLYTVLASGKAPACMLFSESIDSSKFSDLLIVCKLFCKKSMFVRRSSSSSTNGLKMCHCSRTWMRWSKSSLFLFLARNE